MNNKIFKKKVEGVIWGLALGDAMGAPVEKLSHREIKEMHGKVTDLNIEWHKEKISKKTRGYGIITDDTLMAICLINIYNQKREHLDSYDMANYMVKEIAFREMWIPELERHDFLIERLFYPEKNIFFRHAIAGCEPREGGIGNMVNCGAAMYIAPVGVVNACNPENAYTEAINFAMGHQSSYGLEAAGVMAVAVAQAFTKGTTIDEIVKICIRLAKDGTRNAIAEISEKAYAMKEDECAADEFHKILSKYSSIGDNAERDINKLGVGTENYTPSRLKSIEELPIALGYCVLNKGHFMGSMIDGINSGRDTDSIGCMIGAILGALHGIDAIPEKFISQLKERNKLDLTKNARMLYESALQIIANDAKKSETVKKHLHQII